jgi:hypothetical protein
MTAFLPCGWLGHDDSRLTAGAIDKRKRQKTKKSDKKQKKDYKKQKKDYKKRN